MHRATVEPRRAACATILLLVLAACNGGGGGGGGGGTPHAPTVTRAIGGVVTGLAGTGLVLQDNGGDDLVVSGAGASVGFTFPTGLADGAGYAVTVRTQPSGPAQVCRVLRNGSGLVNGANVGDVVVDCHAARFAYVANGDSSGGDAVSIYRVEASSGRLRSMGSAAAGMFPTSVAVDPTGKAAYVASGEDGNLYQFTITATGGLVPMAEPSVRLGGSPQSVTVHPTGGWVYVVGGGPGDQVAQFDVDPAGAATPMATPTVAAGIVPMAVVIDPSGRYAYVANRGFGLLPSAVSQYSVGPSGALDPMTPATVAAGVTPFRVTVDPLGRFAYVTNQGDHVAPGSVSQYRIGAGGGLDPLSPATVATGVAPQGLVVHPSGRFAYVVNAGGDTISQYGVGVGGGLDPLSPATVATGGSPRAIAVDPTGAFAWVTEARSDAVSQWAIGANGTLSPLRPRTAPAGPSPGELALVVTTRPAAARPTGARVYVGNEGAPRGSTVTEYAAAADGVLSLTSVATPRQGVGIGGNTLPGVSALAAHPSGQWAYAMSLSYVAQFTIDAAGLLVPMSTPELVVCYVCAGIAVHPSGAYAYVLDAAWDPNSMVLPNTVEHFTIGPDGALGFLASFPISAGRPNALAIDPEGRYAYVVTALGGLGSIGRYAISPFGTFTDVAPSGASETGTRPLALAVDPSGRFVFVANNVSNDVSAFAIDEVTGALTAIDCGGGPGCHANAASGVADFAAGTGPAGIAIDPAGEHVYVANTGDGTQPGTISQFSVGPGGALTPLVPASVAAFVGSYSIAVDPTGRYVYVGNLGDLATAEPGTVGQYAVGPGGALDPLTVPTVAAGIRPRAVLTTATYE